MVISHFVVVNRNVIARDNISFPVSGIGTPEQLYTALQCQYPKFYKMDTLCKWAFAASEYLFGTNGLPYQEMDKYKIAVALSTSHGCIDVDKRYAATIDMPSPALFVYTLPNIMLGEICIRHGFKGEQLCLAGEQFDAGELYFNVHRLLTHTDTDACLCGWADATGTALDLCLFWVTRTGKGISFNHTSIEQLYRGSR